MHTLAPSSNSAMDESAFIPNDQIGYWAHSGKPALRCSKCQGLLWETELALVARVARGNTRLQDIELAFLIAFLPQ
jgi:hypothetical protein